MVQNSYERYRVFGYSRIHIALCVVQYILNCYGHTCGHQDCIKHITRHTQLQASHVIYKGMEHG